MRMPTEVEPSSTAPAMASTVACSHRAISLGEPRTSASPDPNAFAVSVSRTRRLARPRMPVSKFTLHNANPFRAMSTKT